MPADSAPPRARHGPAPCLPSMPRPPSPARGAHLPTVRLGRLQPAGSHLQDLQGATDGRPAAILFDRLRHARWQPAQGPGRSHSSRPPPLRPVRHPRRRHLLPAPSIPWSCVTPCPRANATGLQARSHLDCIPISSSPETRAPPKPRWRRTSHRGRARARWGWAEPSSRGRETPPTP